MTRGPEQMGDWWLSRGVIHCGWVVVNNGLSYWQCRDRLAKREWGQGGQSCDSLRGVLVLVFIGFVVVVFLTESHVVKCDLELTV